MKTILMWDMKEYPLVRVVLAHQTLACEVNTKRNNPLWSLSLNGGYKFKIGAPDKDVSHYLKYGWHNVKVYEL